MADVSETLKFTLKDDYGVVTLQADSVRFDLTNKDTHARYTHTLDVSSLNTSSKLKMSMSDIQSFGHTRSVTIILFNSTTEVIKVQVVRKDDDRLLNVWIKGKLQQFLLQARFTDSDTITSNDLNVLRTDIRREADKSEENTTPLVAAFIGLIGVFLLVAIFFVCVQSQLGKLHQQFEDQQQKILQYESMLADYQSKLIEQQEQMQSWANFEHSIRLWKKFLTDTFISVGIFLFITIVPIKLSELFNPNA